MVKVYKLTVVRWMKSGDLIYGILTIVNNNVYFEIYILKYILKCIFWNILNNVLLKFAKRVDVKCPHHKKM